MRSTTPLAIRLLIASFSLAVIASACASGDEQEIDVVTAVPSEDITDSASTAEPEDRLEITEAGSASEDGAAEDARQVEQPQPEETPTVDPEALALLETALDLDGRAMNGTLHFEGALTSEFDAGSRALSTPFRIAANGDSAVLLGPVTAAATFGVDLVPDAHIEVRSVGAEVYILLNVLTPDGQGQKTVAMLASDELVAELGMVCDIGFDLTGESSAVDSEGAICDPLGDIAELLDVQTVSSATIEGVEDSGGVPVRRVRIVVPIGALIGEAASEMSDEDGMATAFLEAFGAAGEGVVYEFWIDEDGYLHKFAVDISSFLGVFASMFGGEFGETEDEVLLRVVVEIFSYDDVEFAVPADYTVLPEGITLQELGFFVPVTLPSVDPPYVDPPPTSIPQGPEAPADPVDVWPATPADSADASAPAAPGEFTSEALCVRAGYAWDATATPPCTAAAA